MKTRLLLSTLLCFVSVFVFSQSKQVHKSTSNKVCNVSGIVRYYYNDYLGYKPDIGTEIYFYQQHELDSIINMGLIHEYESLWRKKKLYLGTKQEHENGYWDSNMENYLKRTSGYNENVEESLTAYDKTLSSIFLNPKLRSSKYKTFVDATSSYKIEIPYGSYYMIAFSKNRNRPTVSEFLGRVYISKIEIREPLIIESIDFEL